MPPVANQPCLINHAVAIKIFRRSADDVIFSLICAHLRGAFTLHNVVSVFIRSPLQPGILVGWKAFAAAVMRIELAAVEVGTLSRASNFRMTLLHNVVPILHHQDEIGVANGREPVGDDVGAPFHQPVHCPLNEHFRAYRPSWWPHPK